MSHRSGRALHAARLSIITLVAAVATLSSMPSAYAASTDAMTPTAEGWYQPNPSCTLPAGCVTVPGQPMSVYPARTMHVGWTGGQETARSYIALPFADVGEAIATASLQVPLDTAAADGSNAPEQAKILVCATTATIGSVDGSFDSPPEADCSSGTLARYFASPNPHLEVDLTPLASSLTSATGLALVPDPSKDTSTDSWRVVFSAHDRGDAARTAPASVTFGTASQSEDSTAGVLVPSLTDGSSVFSAVSPPVATGFARTPATALQRTGAIIPSPLTSDGGYAYPIVLLAPLVFIVMVWMTAGALKKDLAPPTGRSD